MTSYWLSTKSPRALDGRSYESAAREAYLREHSSLICPHVIAVDLGMNVRHVRAYQRRLGLRAFTTGNP